METGMFEPEDSSREARQGSPLPKDWPPRVEETERLLIELDALIEQLDPGQQMVLWSESDQDIEQVPLPLKYVTGLEHLKLGVCYLHETLIQLRVERTGR